MAEDHVPPPRPDVHNVNEPRYLYRLDPETRLPVVIGKVFIDNNGDAWVRIDSEELAKGINAENIDGVALLDHATFVSLDQE